MVKKLIISAGGESKRMRNFLLKYFNNRPKHLLPLPTGKTILEEIVEKSLKYFSKIIISSNEKNKRFFQKIFKRKKIVSIEIDKFLTGPLGPICRELLKTRKRVYGCAGDFFCDFYWEEFEKFHNVHRKPISVLVAPSPSMPEGAKFILKGSLIVAWRRVKRTNDFDLINIGAYIIDPVSEVLKAISKIEYHKEDVFYDLFVPKGLVCGYNPGVLGFNINRVSTYKKLLNWLKNSKQNI